MMDLIPRWVRRLVTPVTSSDGEVKADEVKAAVADQVAELKVALQRIERREAARRNGGRPEAC